MATTLSLRDIWQLERVLLREIDPTEPLETEDRRVCVKCKSVHAGDEDCACDNEAEES